MVEEVFTTSMRVNAPRVNVTVTHDEIMRATTRSSSHCMIAEAVKRSFPGAKSVSVDLQTIRFTDAKRGLRFVYLTPRPAQIALLQFDQGVEDIAPFRFGLRNGSATRSGTGRRHQDDPLKDATVTGRPKKAPRVEGGRTPPMGPLSNWHKPGPTAKGREAMSEGGKQVIVGNRRGLRREFGLRSIQP